MSKKVYSNQLRATHSTTCLETIVPNGTVLYPHYLSFFCSITNCFWQHYLKTRDVLKFQYVSCFLIMNYAL